MKQKLLFFLFAPFFTVGQNTWDGSVIPTITTNGSVTIGTLASPFANLNVVNTTKSYGIYLSSNANLAQSQYGIFNTMSVNNNSGIKYGIYNQMIGNTSGVKYGVYSSLQSNGGTSNSYGIYSSVSGSSARAAYFSGNVDMYRSNTIYTATNGSKFMLFSNHTSTSPNSYAISFVPNVTNNQEDWHWGRTLELYRDGSMIKNVTSADQAFTIRRSDWAEDVFRVYGDGKLYAAEINVRLLGDFPDYVFRSDYELIPIEDLKLYIEKNGKLPKMPKASVVENEGLNIGETTRLLVEKIEELTLYMLIQEEKISQLQEKLNLK